VGKASGSRERAPDGVPTDGVAARGELWEEWWARRKGAFVVLSQKVAGSDAENQLIEKIQV
jgi:hypothetical protein